MIGPSMVTADIADQPRNMLTFPRYRTISMAMGTPRRTVKGQPSRNNNAKLILRNEPLPTFRKQHYKKL